MKQDKGLNADNLIKIWKISFAEYGIIGRLCQMQTQILFLGSSKVSAVTWTSIMPCHHHKIVRVMG